MVIVLEKYFDHPIKSLVLELGQLCSWTSRQVRDKLLNNITCGLLRCECFNEYRYTCCVALSSLLISALRSYKLEFESGKVTLSVVAVEYLKTHKLTEKLPGTLYVQVYCPLFT